MHLLIIGGTRFIGPRVVRLLADDGHQVTVYHRGQTETELPTNVLHVHDPAATMPVMSFADELFRRPLPDVVIHMIPMGQADARAAIDTWRHRTRRIVGISSGDVYLAYGRFTRLEPGPPERMPLDEDAPLRTVLFPYRHQAKSADDWIYSYEKILVERCFLDGDAIEPVVLRLPKVYGAGENENFATVYQVRHHPRWRWTHGYVDDVAAAIVLAAIHPAATGRIYNVGEAETPTTEERLKVLPPAPDDLRLWNDGDFDQDIVYDTQRIRRDLQFSESVTFNEGVRRTVG